MLSDTLGLLIQGLGFRYLVQHQIKLRQQLVKCIKHSSEIANPVWCTTGVFLSIFCKINALQNVHACALTVKTPLSDGSLILHYIDDNVLFLWAISVFTGE